MVPNEALIESVRRIFAPASPVQWKRVARGYTSAQRWVVRLDDGSSAFAKAATDEMTADWLRSEYLMYSQLRADFMPRMLGWVDEGNTTILFLEDLSDAHWPPPWTASVIEGVLSTLTEVCATPPPAHLPRLDASPTGALDGWNHVADAPEEFLGLGMCSAEWLDKALPSLLSAERSAPLDGDDLVHLDVRSDNLCVSRGRVLLVDWNLACRANGLLDVAAWLPSLQHEGGPPPEDVSPEASVFAGLISGYFAAHAGEPIIERAPLVRDVQQRQLKTALPWAVRTLGLAPLDGDLGVPLVG